MIREEYNITEWLKDGELINTDDDSDILAISSLQPSDLGEYKCRLRSHENEKLAYESMPIILVQRGDHVTLNDAQQKQPDTTEASVAIKSTSVNTTDTTNSVNDDDMSSELPEIITAENDTTDNTDSVKLIDETTLYDIDNETTTVTEIPTATTTTIVDDEISMNTNETTTQEEQEDIIFVVNNSTNSSSEIQQDNEDDSIDDGDVMEPVALPLVATADSNDTSNKTSLLVNINNRQFGRSNLQFDDLESDWDVDDHDADFMDNDSPLEGNKV